jgi:hypothetical protein
MTATERFKHIEIEICSHCDSNCPTCDRFIDRAPTGPMTLNQIRYFVQESLDVAWEWERIHILGGEPTLHRQFRPVVEALMEYRQYYPKVLLRVISNGMGTLADQRDWLEQNKIALNVEAKDGFKPPYFHNMWRAPQDVIQIDEPLQPCALFGIRGCGIGLTKHGYFLCGAGAAIARVASMNIGIMHLKDLTPDDMIVQSRLLCRLCGHHETMAAFPLDTTETKFWKNTFEQYCHDTRSLEIYGVTP